MTTIKSILIDRDGMTSEEADDLLKDARNDFDERLADGDDMYDFCEEWFSLEPDYLAEFLFR